MRRLPFSQIEETGEDAIEVEDEDVVLRDLEIKVYQEIKVGMSNQRELEELKPVVEIKTSGNQKIVKVTNVIIVARRDIMQGIAGLRKSKEMLQHLPRTRVLMKKIGTLKHPSLWRK